jgi:CHAD domain-containing protein
VNVGGKMKEGWQDVYAAIEACAEEPTEKAVHQVRTRCRRLEALISAVLSARLNTERLRSTGDALLRKIKKIRRAAGPVRDLDIHLSLLETIAGEPPGEDAQKLKKTLQRQRKRASVAALKELERDRPKLERRAARFLDAFNDLPPSEQQLDTTALAKARFLETAAAFPVIRSENLHNFRKRSKQARYIAEINPRSAASVRLAKKLNRVQDAIGAWHDWDVMTEEAAEILGSRRTPLLRNIQANRNKAYRVALRIARQTQREALRDAS